MFFLDAVSRETICKLINFWGKSGVGLFPQGQSKAGRSGQVEAGRNGLD